MQELREFWAEATDPVALAVVTTGALGVLLPLWLLQALGVPM